MALGLAWHFWPAGGRERWRLLHLSNSQGGCCCCQSRGRGLRPTACECLLWEPRGHEDSTHSSCPCHQSPAHLGAALWGVGIANCPPLQSQLCWIVGSVVCHLLCTYMCETEPPPPPGSNQLPEVLLTEQGSPEVSRVGYFTYFLDLHCDGCETVGSSSPSSTPDGQDPSGSGSPQRAEHGCSDKIRECPGQHFPHQPKVETTQVSFHR